VNKLILVKIFLRSFFIHTTLNFRRMQNMGFAMAVIPLVREWNLTQKDAAKFLTRHLQMFNTHPYFSASVVGSVIRLEEEQIKGIRINPLADVVAIKQVLAGPYAAIGDTFFWGALRPFAVIVSCVLAYMGYVLAPLAFLLLYTPAHILIRLKGFLEGYRRGKLGIEFIRLLDLPRIAVNIRWGSLIVLAGWAAFLLSSKENLSFINLPGIVMKLATIAVILVCIGLIKKRISQFYVLYCAAIIFLLISMKDFLN
jgi:mannose PTS system EIID component